MHFNRELPFFLLLSQFKGIKRIRGKNFESFHFHGAFNGHKVDEVLFSFEGDGGLKKDEEYLILSKLIGIREKKVYANKIEVLDIKYLSVDLN